MAVNLTCKYTSQLILKVGLREPLKLPLLQCSRNMAKHWNPKWKLLRKLKVMKVKLPDFHEKPYEEMTKDEVRSKMKEMGMLPPRPWTERSVYISCTNGILEPYVPPEGDGKMSIISKEGAKQKVVHLEKKSKSMVAVRKIRSYDEDFDPRDFARDAQQIYIEAHNALKDKDYDRLEKYVTEKAHLEMVNNIDCKTLHWKFLASIEPPRMVHCRYTNLITETNFYCQSTVRFHTQQMLAIYDRFGRLMYGSEILAKDVIEYVVFEKHLTSQYGNWRLHGKIIPDWMPKPEPSSQTYIHRDEPEPDPVSVTPDVSTTEVIESKPDKPQLAVA